MLTMPKGLAGLDGGVIVVGEIKFQSGPIGQHGVNGLQVEDLLETAMERLLMLNRGDHVSRYNSEAIYHLQEALAALDRRTADREARGVEGTNAR